MLNNNNNKTKMCISCRKYNERKDMIRIVKLPNSDDVIVDKNQKKDGRGAHICKNKNCFEIMKKKNKLSYALKLKNKDLTDVYKQIEYEFE